MVLSGVDKHCDGVVEDTHDKEEKNQYNTIDSVRGGLGQTKLKAGKYGIVKYIMHIKGIEYYKMIWSVCTL